MEFSVCSDDMLLHKEEIKVKRIAILLFLAVSMSQAADVHYMWLPFSSNVPGAPQTNTAVTQWGINVMMDSDNPKVTEFEVTVVARLASGEIRTTVGKVARDGKAMNVQYSTIYSLLVDSDPKFAILAIQVKALSGVSVTQPAAGRDYSGDQKDQ
jgi:hypothetical protein